MFFLYSCASQCMHVKDVVPSAVRSSTESNHRKKIFLSLILLLTGWNGTSLREIIPQNGTWAQFINSEILILFPTEGPHLGFWFICHTFYPKEIPVREVVLIEGLLGFAVLNIPDCSSFVRTVFELKLTEKQQQWKEISMQMSYSCYSK